MAVSKPRQAWLKALVAKYADGDLQDFSERVKIGARLGEVSGVYIGAILRKNDPKPVSKKVWDNLIAKEKFKPVDPAKGGPTAQTEKVIEAELSELASEMRLMRHLLNAVLDRLPPKP